ncbi:universal stress global response regulator UspA [Vibrio sp. UCD-FRSSP16_10]|uniref:universal stress protein n=1 Tax=unclassified Vibrio TaxID=2614977 RepID=UPI0008020E81|nr:MULTISPECIES: universal stress protein [unclassified Vibrio]OBT16362.1 universal stress global response regulator UspA [Vibrio sp. UCD-FRSSP16_30]OBT21226.1 universal stress global response regulator UspA [Vibrio sp. UCD-FRSSP16_10]
MKYQHILVALELSEDSKLVIDRAISLAKVFDADVSFVHIDGSHGEIYPELIDIQTDKQQPPIKQVSLEKLKQLTDGIEQPIKHFLIGTGDLSDKLPQTIGQYGCDLLVCGHHHDFWSRIISYSKHLIHNSPVDILVVPLKDD